MSDSLENQNSVSISFSRSFFSCESRPRLTIGHIGEIKRHCKAEKHLKGKESSPYSRASKRQADPQFLFSDELCSDQLSPVYNSRPYKRKTFEETIDELNLQGWNTIESQQTHQQTFLQI